MFYMFKPIVSMHFLRFSTSNPVQTTDNVEFGRNTMCHFLSSFFRSLTRGFT